MLLTSFSFFVFLPVVFYVFYALKPRHRAAWLLAASLVFCGAFGLPHLLLALAGCTLASYAGGRQMAGASARARPMWLWGGIAANLLVLALVRYLPFLGHNTNSVLGLLGVDWRVSEPAAVASVGASFYVFQGISYLVDVYLETVEPERRAGIFALHMAFFPRLLQGPIERADRLIPQFSTLEPARREDPRAAITLLAWGLVKKVVVADRVAGYVDTAYGNVHAHAGLPLLLATYGFALQLYFDFSGYTDMARGAARLFGVRLSQNFNRPYTATAIADFWRRWHMSFSSWILDYLFRPLQMSWREWRTWGSPLAIFVTFALSGVWHGASWSFIVWGLLHGLYMASATLYRPVQKRFYRRFGGTKPKWVRPWQTLVTFHLVCLSWVFFRAESVRDGVYVAISAIVDLPASVAAYAREPHLLTLGQSPKDLWVAGLAVLLAFLAERREGRDVVPAEALGELAWVSRLSLWPRAVLYAVTL